MTQATPARRAERAATSQLRQVRLEAAIQQSLRKSGYVALSRLECHCREGTAVLVGRVPTFYMKQVAQTIVRRTDGVAQVNNQLEVFAD